MCQSKVDGGQRCYAHTRAAMERVLANPRPRDPDWHSAVDEAMTEHATTTRGRPEIAALATPGDEWSTLRVQAYLATADRRVRERRQITQEVARHVTGRAALTSRNKAAWAIGVGDQIIRDARWNSRAISSERSDFVKDKTLHVKIDAVIESEAGELSAAYRDGMNRRERAEFRTQVLETFWARAHGY